MKLIGLAGKAGAGKDTFAEFALEWCEQNGVTGERVAFGDILKVSVARTLLGPDAGTTQECVDFCNKIKQPNVQVVVFETVFDPDEPPRAEVWAKLSGRKLLQHFGTEAHRDLFGSDFWIKAVENRLGEMAGAVDVVFLPDIRFEQEADMVHGHGGKVWEILCPEFLKEDERHEHSSEAGLPPYIIDRQIVNGGTFDEFREKVRGICEGELA